MKKIGSLILAAIIGSVISLGGYHFFINNSQQDGVQINYQPTTPVSLTANSAGAVDFTHASEKATPGVVHIKSKVTSSSGYAQQRVPDPFRDFFGDDFFSFPQPQQPRERVASGSGVIISKDGYIVTNNHVISKANEIEVSLHDNRTYKAKVIGTDPSTDLALVKIDADNLQPIPFANSDDIKTGEWVLAVGNPFDLTSTVTAGIVSAKARSINILKDKSAIEAFIQTDAAVNPGNSGGALVNLKGGLIGINTAIASPTGAYAGYAFSVPSNIVKKVVEDLIEYGVVQRGYLGVLIKGLDGNLAQELELDITEGVYVDSIMPESAAQEAGLKKGDVIISAAGTDINTTAKLQEIVGRHRPGDEISLIVNRDGKEKQFEVELKNIKGTTEIVKKPKKEISSVLGAEFENLSKKELKKLGIDHGVRVAELHAGKLRKSTNMRKGFIITKIDGKKVNSVEELIDILENKKGGVLIEGIYPGYSGVFYYALGL